MRQASPPRRGAFTVIELMVVVFIIGVLVAILVPVIAGVRRRAYATDTQNWVMQIAAACENYQQDFRAYPGPLGDNQLRNSSVTFPPFIGFGMLPSAGAAGYDTTIQQGLITGSENLVLGLCGGLIVVPAGSNFALAYDPTQVGSGPSSLNTANPARHAAYMDTQGLSWRQGTAGKTGQFADDAGSANDSLIPEFVDRFPNGPMPILYLRAKRGVPIITTGQTTGNNSVITAGSYDATGNYVGTYDLKLIIGYTDSNIGVERSLPANEYVFTAPPHGLKSVDPTVTLTNPPPAGLTYRYPADAYPYFQNPAMPNTARNKDSFILISAGRDRVYGTRDDIVNFGQVGE